MDIEFGIQHVARPVTFTTDQDEQSVTEHINQAIANQSIIDLVDTKGRHIIVPAAALGYAIVGSQTKHAVGFGAI